MAERRSAAAAAARKPQARPQLRLASPGRCRHHVHAGQMGISLVRGLGPRLPLRHAVLDRSRVRQGAARAAVPRMADESERRTAGLRMGVRRRQPARARLGGHAGVRERPRSERRPRRPRFPGAHLPQAAAELHLVGEPQGPAGLEHLRGRLPRPRQYRRVRPLAAAAHRRAHRAIRRHRLDGDVQHQHAAHVDRAQRARCGLRGHDHQVPGALPLYRRSHDRHGQRGHRTLGRSGQFLLRRAFHAVRTEDSHAAALDGRAYSAVRRRDRRAGGDQQAARALAQDRDVSGAPAGFDEARFALERGWRRRDGVCSRSRAPSA